MGKLSRLAVWFRHEYPSVAATGGRNVTANNRLCAKSFCSGDGPSHQESVRTGDQRSELERPLGGQRPGTYQVRALLSSLVPIWVPTDTLRLRSGREIQCRKTLKND
jgi:hypothetical protein